MYTIFVRLCRLHFCQICSVYKILVHVIEDGKATRTTCVPIIILGSHLKNNGIQTIHIDAFKTLLTQRYNIF